MIEKKIQYQGLDILPTYITDTSTNSRNYFDLYDVPEQLTSGKNFIKLKANANNLAVNSQILAEIIDSSGNPIYYEIPDFIDEDGSRIIVIYIYNDTPAGNASIHLLGTALYDLNGNPVPVQYQNVLNVKWSKNITIKSDQRNDSPILFSDTDLPQFSVKELVRPYLSRYFHPSQSVKYSTGKVSYALYGSNPTIFGNNFIKQMEGGTITVYPTGSLPSLPSGYSTNTSYYTASITKVLRSTELVLGTAYTQSLINNNLKQWAVNSFTGSNYTIHYQTEPTYSRTQASRSLAFIDIKNIDNLTGDVYRIKSYIKNNSSISTWELVDDTILEESDFRELLIDTGSIDVKTKTGNLINQNTINQYWSGQLVRVYSPSGRQLSSPSIDFKSHVTESFDIGSVLPRSMKISIATSSLYPYQYIKVFNSGSLGLFKNYFTNDVQYSMSFSAVGQPSNQIGKFVNLQNLVTSSYLPYIEIYMSGSGFNPLSGNELIGKKIGEINVNKLASPSQNAFYRFDNSSYTFTPDQSGYGTPIFKINSGTWNLSDVSIKPLLDTGFNPNEIKLLIPLPKTKINSQIDLKFEYYDYLSNQSRHTDIVKGVFFSGSNSVLEGSFNIITGSLFISDDYKSGVEIRGKRGGMLRSMGYTGWTSASHGTSPGGFLIWSGSALSNGGAYYKGSGVELHGGSGSAPGGKTHALRFRTDTGKLEISGSIVADSAILNQYTLSDYFGNNIIVIDTLAKRDLFFKNYSYNHVSWSLLDLSGQNAATQSGMFVKIQTAPKYPISHVQIPTVPNIKDNKIGGTVLIQFSSVDTTASATFFKDQGVGKYSSSLYLFSGTKPNLSSSNAIVNLSGSFVFGGYSYSPTIGSFHYTGSNGGTLRGKNQAIYIFSKGSSGWNLNSSTDYDRTTFSILNGYISNQTGTVRSIYKDVTQDIFNLSNGLSPSQSILLPTYNFLVDKLMTAGTDTYIGKWSVVFTAPEWVYSKDILFNHMFFVETVGGGNYSITPNYTQSYTAATFNKDISPVANQLNPISINFTGSLNTVRSGFSNQMYNVKTYTKYTPASNSFQSTGLFTTTFNFKLSRTLTGTDTLYYMGTVLTFDSGSNTSGWLPGDMASGNFIR